MPDTIQEFYENIKPVEKFGKNFKNERVATTSNP
jgi:hypothetical protein